MLPAWLQRGRNALREPSDTPAQVHLSERTVWRIFVVLCVVLLPLMVASSFEFGATWDERDRHKYGQLVIEFFKGLRSRGSFTEESGGLYGGLFDALSAAVEPWVPLNRYVLRHILNAVFGWAGVVYCGRLAAKLFGPLTGVLAMVLLASSPRYFADAMNNPKDLPFAVATVAALYYMATIAPRWPYLSWSNAAKIAVALAVALNIRAAAVLYLGYFVLLMAALTIAEWPLPWRCVADTAVRVAVVMISTLLLGTLVWPWAQVSPFIRPFEAMSIFSRYPWSGTHVLFAGHDYSPAELPWSYVPWWLLISTPPVVLAGAALACTGRDSRSGRFEAALWMVALLPLTLIVVRRSTLYNGIRQLLFVYPIVTVLAASGWMSWLTPRRSPLVRWSVAVLLAVGLADVVGFDVRNHPNETVYFNQLVGGPRGAFTKYEMDYWGNCMLQAVTWSEHAARLSGVPIAVSGDPATWLELVQTNTERYHGVYATRPDAGLHELQIQLARGTIADLREIATRKDALHRVQTADGTVLCAVLPGPAFAQLQPRFVAP